MTSPRLESSGRHRMPSNKGTEWRRKHWKRSLPPSHMWLTTACAFSRYRVKAGTNTEYICLCHKLAVLGPVDFAMRWSADPMYSAVLSCFTFAYAIPAGATQELCCLSIARYSFIVVTLLRLPLAVAITLRHIQTLTHKCHRRTGDTRHRRTIVFTN